MDTVFRRIVDVVQVVHQGRSEAVWDNRDECLKQLLDLESLLHEHSMGHPLGRTPEQFPALPQSIAPRIDSDQGIADAIVGAAGTQYLASSMPSVAPPTVNRGQLPPSSVAALRSGQARSCELPTGSPLIAARRTVVGASRSAELPGCERSLALPPLLAAKYRNRFTKSSRSLDEMPTLHEGNREDNNSSDSDSEDGSGSCSSEDVRPERVKPPVELLRPPRQPRAGSPAETGVQPALNSTERRSGDCESSITNATGRDGETGVG